MCKLGRVLLSVTSQPSSEAIAHNSASFSKVELWTSSLSKDGLKLRRRENGHRAEVSVCVDPDEMPRRESENPKRKLRTTCS